MTRLGAPYSVRPSQEQDTVARAAAKRSREVIMVTDRVTGRVKIRQRGADSSGDEASGLGGALVVIITFC